MYIHVHKPQHSQPSLPPSLSLSLSLSRTLTHICREGVIKYIKNEPLNSQNIYEGVGIAEQLLW